MKVYIGGKLSDRLRLHEIRRQVWEAGHEVVSTWIDEGEDHSFKFGGKKAYKIAIRDLCQISSADLFIIDTMSPLTAGGGGGREFEFGFAIGQFQHKIIWRVGPVNSSFHSLVDRKFKTWEEAIETLKEIKDERCS